MCYIEEARAGARKLPDKTKYGGKENMMSDIEIAQGSKPLKITEVAAQAGVDEKYVEQYGSYKAKI